MTTTQFSIPIPWSRQQRRHTSQLPLDAAASGKTTGTFSTLVSFGEMSSNNRRGMVLQIAWPCGMQDCISNKILQYTNFQFTRVFFQLFRKQNKIQQRPFPVLHLVSNMEERCVKKMELFQEINSNVMQLLKNAQYILGYSNSVQITGIHLSAVLIRQDLYMLSTVGLGIWF